MSELLATIVVFALAGAALGIGLLFGRRPVQGSCGGLNNIPGVESDCGGSCRKPCRRRRQHDAAHHTQTEAGEHR